ncbi:sensor histidine kinase [Amycolatopsis suaedae]|uniref:Two-component sensor histidine kinase n=1 Tax=Amycolatopsis suaedae TaxID=2510978 RepID=A0A4Q7J384_9PSEU|nr:histidine kinase [Amycolatopsis suaedae]RZQ61407.1 two-component sensor histidine kinase [Amycolatopsis suaedae]
MRRDELWSGIFGTLVCVTVAVPVLVVQLSGGATGAAPFWLWWICFAGYATALVVCTWLVDLTSAVLVRRVFAAQVLLGAALVLLAPQVGWTPILLVYTAATSGYLVGRRTSAAIIVLHTGVVAAAVWMTSGRLVEMLLLPLLYLLLQLGVLFGVLVQLREARTRQELAGAHVELRAATALLAESTRADERLRISRELHDLIGHQLTVLALELEVAAHTASGPAAEHVTQARATARGLLGDVRAAVGELRRRSPDLRDTLRELVADLPEPTVHLRVDDTVRVDETRTAALIRCVQEVVTNAIRHAEATQLWIEITGTGGEVRFSAWDDGRGAAAIRPGNGLRGITERVEELGGRVEFAGGGGFRVLAQVPAP